MADELPKVSFGVIVLNGEPFTRYCLRSLYPFAHEIIVVEGASAVARTIATDHGHSQDGTLEVLRRFKLEEDPDDKIQIVTAEDHGYPNGFWPGDKDEQSNAYACRASGDYLWQVDIDEFYKPADMRHVLEMLRDDPQIAAVSFKQITFWGGFDYLTDGWYLQRGADIYHRVFKWQPGFEYATHRPPTVVDESGHDLRERKYVDGEKLAERGVLLYHYSLLFPKQVREKCAYYEAGNWHPRAQEWARNVYFELRNPFQVHNVYSHPSWLERFEGTHPPQVAALKSDIALNKVEVEVRSTADVERLLDSRFYRVGRFLVQVAEPLSSYARQVKKKAKGVLRRLLRTS